MVNLVQLGISERVGGLSLHHSHISFHIFWGAWTDYSQNMALRLMELVKPKEAHSPPMSPPPPSWWLLFLGQH